MQNKIVSYCKPKKIQLVSLGCSKNTVDSEHLLRQVENMGIEIVPSNYELSESSKVDAVVINTCGFINDAKEESIEAIFSAVAAKNCGYVGKIYVFGCLSQRYMNELIESIEEVDGFFGAFDWEGVLKALGGELDKKLLEERYLTTPKHYAYLKISEGCDRTCSYCAIPLIRGKHISVPIEKLVKEAQFLASRGVRELIVIAQDTTYYGLDLYKKRSLALLLEKLCEVEGIEWIRIHYSYPAQFPEDVLDVMAKNPKICKYLDIPLQHASTKVLDLMRRSIDGPTTQSIIDKIREKVPGCVLRTTLIVGHPGEDKREYEKLLRFVEKNRFDRLGAFTYSEEEGTYSAENYADDIPEDVKQNRLDRLMALQAEISADINAAKEGETMKVIVDREEPDYYIGRTQFDSPEVDPEVLISKDKILQTGQFYTVKINSSSNYELFGSVE